MQKIIPNLWFDSQAEEAAKFYVAIFNDARIGRVSYYGDAGNEIHRQEKGKVMTVDFQIEGQQFVALNGGPQFLFNEAVSFIIHCDSQEEGDYYWEKLTDGGDPAAQQCGWLKDKFGVSWQIVPTAFLEMMEEPDVQKTARVMEALLTMKKIEIGLLEKAFEGES